MKTIKVFYSWQSDLPGNTNKNFINNCIEDAVNNCNRFVDSAEILADRDTKGRTGSPNISQTIFEKIDECDLFIADVSIINSVSPTEDDATGLDVGPADGKFKIRYTPNPNVLIELGYAVKCIGWERVICFINTDYGEIGKLPFDLEHQRVTPYSLSDGNKKAVKKQLRGIITDTILELSKQARPPKKGKSFHVVGTYDPKNKTITADLTAFDVGGYHWVDEYFRERKDKALMLTREISSYDIPIRIKEESTLKAAESDPQNAARDFRNRMIGLGGSGDNMVDYKIERSVKDAIVELASKYLELDASIFDESFFNIGSMKIQSYAPVSFLTGKGELWKDGSDEEKEKDDKIHELHNILAEMRQLDLYLKTFDHVLLFPLAIANNSTEADTDIEVTIQVDGSCEPISPSARFINPEIKDDAAAIYQAGFPRDLLVMQNDSDIKYEDDEFLYYDPDEPFFGNPLPGFPANIGDRDYGNAIETYIATPDSENRFVFVLESLRAAERKWLGGIIAIKKPVNQDTVVKMQYRIISNNTSGDLEGELIYTAPQREPF